MLGNYLSTSLQSPADKAETAETHQYCRRRHWNRGDGRSCTERHVINGEAGRLTAGDVKRNASDHIVATSIRQPEELDAQPIVGNSANDASISGESSNGRAVWSIEKATIQPDGCDIRAEPNGDWSIKRRIAAQNRASRICAVIRDEGPVGSGKLLESQWARR